MKKTIEIKFQKQVRAKREAMQLRQEDLAKRIGVSRQIICDLENGRSRFSLWQAHAIAKVLGLGLDVL